MENLAWIIVCTVQSQKPSHVASHLWCLLKGSYSILLIFTKLLDWDIKMSPSSPLCGTRTHFRLQRVELSILTHLSQSKIVAAYLIL